jgi:hypothetical protein
MFEGVRGEKTAYSNGAFFALDGGIELIPNSSRSQELEDDSFLWRNAVEGMGLLDLGTVRLVDGKSRSRPFLAFGIFTVAVEFCNATLSALGDAYPHGR